MDTFLKIASNQEKDFASMAILLNGLILDAEGNPVLSEGVVLPPKVLMAVFTKMVEQLGK
jgi:DNA mismatch repair protein MutH